MDRYPVVELRVHGVSGTPPGELLERDEVVRLRKRSAAGAAGSTGFYRPARDDLVLDHNGDQQPLAFLEGYTWGGLTSGAASRALWLLLLPFALVNAAPRLRPVGGADGRGAQWALLTLCRLLALTLTATFTVATAGVGVDLLAWQCGGEPGRCTNLPNVVGFITWPQGHRLLIGLVLPVLVLVLVYLLSRATASRYERFVEPALTGTEPAASPDDIDPKPGHPWLWRGDHMVRRQRSVHLQVGLLVVVLLLGESLSNADHRRVLWTFVLVTILFGALLLCLPSLVGRRARPPWWWLARLLWLPTAAALTLIVRSLAHNAVREDLGGPLRAYDAMITWLFAVQLGLLLLITVMVLMLRYRTPMAERDYQAMRGMGTVLMASVACMLSAVLSAGVYLSVANLITDGPLISAVPGAPRGQGLLLPLSLQVTAVAALGAAAAVAIVLLVALPAFLVGWRWSVRSAELLVGYPDRDPLRPLPDRDRALRRIFWRARSVERAPKVLVPILGALTVWAVAVCGLVVMGWFVPAAHGLVVWIADHTTLVAVGAYVFVGLMGLLVAVAFLALRYRRTRRVVGIMWDLMSFWPRAVHPMAPPCYAERIVPELIGRIRIHTGDRGDEFDGGGYPVGALVLAAHSQGTVIAAATLLQLAGLPDGDRVLPRVALLTYGCVLRRLYSRYFPTYFGMRTLADLAALQVADRVGGIRTGPACGTRWRNLWRLSDQLGGPIEFDVDTAAAIWRRDRLCDLQLIDPPYRASASTPPLAHSDFPHDTAFQQQVGALAEALRGGQRTNGAPVGRT